MEAATAELRLSCGHSLTEVETSSEGTSYCAGCEREAASDSGQVALPVVRPATTSAPGLNETDSEPSEEQVRTDSEAAPGGGQDRSRALAHEGEEPRQDGADADPPQPVYGTRADAPGPRGCWALKADGSACGAVKRKDGDYCTAHAGLGVAADPKRWAPKAHEARREQLATRARLRLVLGDRGRQTARGVLREKAILHSERLAGRAIAAALSPEVDDAKAAGLALSIIREAEPRKEATLEVSGDLASGDLSGLSLGQLLQLAAEHGIEPISPASTPPALPAGETS